jgi:hypothetical protein
MTAIQPRGTEEELQEKRRNYSVALLEEPAKTLPDLTDAEFNNGMDRITRGQERMQKILATVLKPKVHFDNPNNAFQSPILLKAGAEELRRLMRVRVRRIAEPQVEATTDWVSVTVHLGIYDEMNRLIAERTANCNTLEKRFRNRKGEWTYRDPREMVHQCLAMAEKRAAIDLTEEASGATGFFQTEQALIDGIEDGAAEVGCSEADKKRMKDAAVAKRMTKEDFYGTIVGATGRPMGEGSVPFVTADEVQDVLDAIEQWQPRAPVPTTTVDPNEKPRVQLDPNAPLNGEPFPE